MLASAQDSVTLRENFLTRIFKTQIKPVDPVYKTFAELMFLSKNLYSACRCTGRQFFFQMRDCKVTESQAAMKGWTTVN